MQIPFQKYNSTSKYSSLPPRNTYFVYHFMRPSTNMPSALSILQRYLVQKHHSLSVITKESNMHQFIATIILLPSWSRIRMWRIVCHEIVSRCTIRSCSKSRILGWLAVSEERTILRQRERKNQLRRYWPPLRFITSSGVRTGKRIVPRSTQPIGVPYLVPSTLTAKRIGIHAQKPCKNNFTNANRGSFFSRFSFTVSIHLLPTLIASRTCY